MSYSPIALIIYILALSHVQELGVTLVHRFRICYCFTCWNLLNLLGEVIIIIIIMIIYIDYIMLIIIIAAEQL